MKRLVLIVAALGCFAAFSRGADSASQPAASSPATQSWAAVMLPKMVEVCGLSEEQQKKLIDIDAAAASRLADFRKANDEKINAAVDAVKAANTSGDKDAMAKAMADYQALVAPYKEIFMKAHNDIQAVLTPPQRDAWQEFQVLNHIYTSLSAANLTAEQTGKIKAAYAELAKNKDIPVSEMVQQLFAKATDLLTPEQTRAIEEMQAKMQGMMGQSGAAPAGGAAATQPSAPAGH